MQSFIFNDAITFKLATQQDDTGAKVQVFFGVFLGVMLRWLYSIAVAIRGMDDDHRPSRSRARFDVLRIFRVLAKGQRPACQHEILECARVRHFD